jgi:hypothetical protein
VEVNATRIINVKASGQQLYLDGSVFVLVTVLLYLNHQVKATGQVCARPGTLLAPTIHADTIETTSVRERQKITEKNDPIDRQIAEYKFHVAIGWYTWKLRRSD